MAEVTLVIDIVVSLCDYPIPSALTAYSICVLHWSLILLTTSEIRDRTKMRRRERVFHQ